MRFTHLRLYQVIDRKPGEGLRLADLWSGDQVWVSERLGSQHVVRGDLLAVRLVKDGQGGVVVEGAPYPFGDLSHFFKRVGVLFHHFWIEYVALRPLPTLVTAEGDPPVSAQGQERSRWVG